MSEASARIEINKVLEAVDWPFIVDGKRSAKVQLEPKPIDEAPDFTRDHISAIDALNQSFLDEHKPRDE